MDAADTHHEYGKDTGLCINMEYPIHMKYQIHMCMCDHYKFVSHSICTNFVHVSNKAVLDTINQC